MMNVQLKKMCKETKDDGITQTTEHGIQEMYF